MMGRSESEIRFAYFDCGGTLLRVRPSVGVIYSERAAALGFCVDSDLLNERFLEAWEASRRRSRGRQFSCSDEILRDEWLQIVSHTFGESIPRENIGRVFEDLYEYFVAPSAWTLDPGIRPMLEILRGKGIGLGVLSNWDRRLKATLAKLDLLDLFDQLVVSNEVGFEKPHPAIFEEAIEKSGCEPDNILHVGDSLEADILPAVELGLTAIWVKPPGPRGQPPGGVHCCDTLTELVESEWDSILSSLK